MKWSWWYDIKINEVISDLIDVCWLLIWRIGGHTHLGSTRRVKSSRDGQCEEKRYDHGNSAEDLGCGEDGDGWIQWWWQSLTRRDERVKFIGALAMEIAVQQRKTRNISSLRKGAEEIITYKIAKSILDPVKTIKTWPRCGSSIPSSVLSDFWIDTVKRQESDICMSGKRNQPFYQLISQRTECSNSISGLG